MTALGTSGFAPNPMDFYRTLLDAAKRGLMTADQVQAVWAAYSQALPGGTPHLAEAPAVWQALADRVRDRRISFNDALAQWGAFLATAATPDALAPTIARPNAGASARAFGSDDPIRSPKPAPGPVGPWGPGAGTGGELFQEGDKKDKPRVYAKQEDDDPPPPPGNGNGNGNGDQKEFCCVEEFNYPKTLSTLAYADYTDIVLDERTKEGLKDYHHYQVGFRFTADALFTQGAGCVCSCCSFRQDVHAAVVTSVHAVHERLKSVARGDQPDDLRPRREDKEGAGTGYGDRGQPAGSPRAGESRSNDAYFPDRAAAGEAVAAVESMPSTSADRPERSRQTQHINKNRLQVAHEKASRDLKTLEGEIDAAAQEDLKKARAAGDKKAEEAAFRRTRRGGCYYWMVDSPRAQVLPGQLTYVLWAFYGKIVQTCDGLRGPSARSFVVAARIDWTDRRADKPTVEYGFVGVKAPVVNFGTKTSVEAIIKRMQGERTLDLAGDLKGYDGEKTAERAFEPVLKGHEEDSRR